MTENNVENDEISNKDFYMSTKTNAADLTVKSNNQNTINKKTINNKNFLYSIKENSTPINSSIKDTIDTRNTNIRLSSAKNSIKNTKTEKYNFNPKNCLRCEIIELNNAVKKEYKENRENRSKEINNKKGIYFNYNNSQTVSVNKDNNNNSNIDNNNKKIVVKNNKKSRNNNNNNNYIKCKSEPSKKYNKMKYSHPKRQLIKYKNNNIKLSPRSNVTKHFNSEKKLPKSQIKMKPNLTHGPITSRNYQSNSNSKNNKTHKNKKKINKSVNEAVNEVCLEDVSEFANNNRLIKSIIVPNGKNIFQYRNINNYQIGQNRENRIEKKKNLVMFINNDKISEKDENSYNRVNSHSGVDSFENAEIQVTHSLNNKITKYFKKNIDNTKF